MCRECAQHASITHLTAQSVHGSLEAGRSPRAGFVDKMELPLNENLPGVNADFSLFSAEVIDSAHHGTMLNSEVA